MRGRGVFALAMALVAAPDRACARDLAIPSCTLAEAIDIIARGTGASIGTTNPALLRRRIASKRVSGGVDNMLRQILGNGVMLRRLGGDSWLIVGLRRLEAEPVSALIPMRPPEPGGAAIVVARSRSDAALHAFPLTARVMPGAMIDAAAAMRGSDALADRVALVSGTHLGPGRDKLFLRGIADSSFAGTRAATVAPYLGEQRLTYRAADPGLLPLDLEQVEVLPGPHGTLYGAGALGGIVRLQPRAPDFGEASARGWGGISATAHGAMGGDLGVLANLPVVEGQLGLRVLGYRSDAGGYIDDMARGDKDVNRVRTTGGRLALRYRQGDWTADIGGAVQAIRSHDAQYAQPGTGSGAAGALERRSGVAEPSSDHIALASATVRRGGGPVHVSATVGAVEQRMDQNYAATARDGGAILCRQADHASLVTIEARAWREPGDGPGWMGGVSILSSRARQIRSVLPESPGDRLRVRNDNTELSAFGEVTLDAGPGLSFTGGLRLSRMTLDGDALGKLDSFYFSREQEPVSVARSETRLLPSLAATLKLHGKGRAYARYERGYRPGGVAGGIVSRKFASDRIGTLEVGLRDVGTGPLEWNATLAWSQWRDVQGDLLTPVGLTYTENIGDARVFSADVTGRAQVTGRLQLLGAAMVVRDRLHPLEYLRDGSRSLPNVPGLSLRGEARYRLPLRAGRSLGLGALVVHEGVSHLGAGANLGLRQGGVTRLDLSGRLELDRAVVALSVENLLDARGDRFALGNPFTLRAGAQTTPQRPRTVRLGFEAGF